MRAHQNCKYGPSAYGSTRNAAFCVVFLSISVNDSIVASLAFDGLGEYGSITLVSRLIIKTELEIRNQYSDMLFFYTALSDCFAQEFVRP